MKLTIKKMIMFLSMVSLSLGLIGCGSKEVAKEEGEGESVVVSSVAAVEILDALGVAMEGVPTTEYELPKSVEEKTRIGNPMSPDMEVITSLNPTVIVSVDSLQDSLKAEFEKVSAETEFINLSSYQGLKNSIKRLGTRFGKEEGATSLIKKLEEKEKNINAKIQDKSSPTVLVLFGTGKSFMAASNTSYVGDLVRYVGGTNIIENDKTPFIPVDMEYLSDKDPDYILLMSHANREQALKSFKDEFEMNKVWQNFSAVKEDRVVALPTHYFGMSANLLAGEALEQLQEILYAE